MNRSAPLPYPPADHEPSEAIHALARHLARRRRERLAREKRGLAKTESAAEKTGHD